MTLSVTPGRGNGKTRGEGAESNVITVLLVDDQPSLLKGLEMLFALEADLRVVGTATTGEAALDLAARLLPDVVVMDMRLPGLDGVAVTRQIDRRFPRCKVVALSLYDDPETRRRAAEAGVYAFVAKHDMDGTLLATIRKAALSR